MKRRIRFIDMQFSILKKLRNELSPDLFYHNIHHTIDVYIVASQLANEEKLKWHEELLLKTAVLYHDSGYIVQAEGHEEFSCQIAEESLPRFGYADNDIALISGMIRATKIPQTPKTKLEEIICDADLHYLGRADYDELSSRLYKEINSSGDMDEGNWLKLQISFFETHHYFTATALRNQWRGKDAKLKILKQKLIALNA